MRSLMFLLAALSVIATGYWAYYENYRTKAELDRVEDLRAEIRGARGRLAILRAEWAYLNRPDRLRDLAEINFDRLGLLQLRPDQFGRIDQVAYPQPDKIDLSQPVDVISSGATSP